MTEEAMADDGRVFDMHCHLDFAPDASAAARELAACGTGAFSVTVAPSDYERAHAAFATCDNVRVGLGLHPWWIADGRCGAEDVALFERLAHGTRFIGEIGLDFARDRAATRDVQLGAFERAVAACADGGKVLSIHAVRAAGDVLDVLERAADGGVACENACIFHWFSGTSDELHRAVGAGCFFSVNPRMLAAKRGRAYAQAVPLDRLLLETDAPSASGEPYDAPARVADLGRLLADLAVLRGVPRAELAARIADTSARLLDLL